MIDAVASISWLEADGAKKGVQVYKPKTPAIESLFYADGNLRIGEG